MVNPQPKMAGMKKDGSKKNEQLFTLRDRLKLKLKVSQILIRPIRNLLSKSTSANCKNNRRRKNNGRHYFDRATSDCFSTKSASQPASQIVSARTSCIC